MAGKIPVGIDDFSELVRGEYIFVDHTLMIREFIDSGNKVTLFTRIRRSGKTLNLSMLHHFFAPEVHGKPTAGLFDKCKIAQEEKGEYLAKYQGQSPVISVCFKDVHQKTFAEAFAKIRELIAATFDQFSRELAGSEKLTSLLKKQFEQLCNADTSTSSSILENSLKILSECLFQYYGKKVYILIDEYDALFQDAYENGYLEEITILMRNLLSSALKSNPALEQGVLTGVLRLAKANIFSGLNNLNEKTLLDDGYERYFGFTEEEVRWLFEQASLSNVYDYEHIKAWYNGYRHNNVVLYNPWSIIKCIEQKGNLGIYWLDTAKNTLLIQKLKKASPSIIEQLIKLLQSSDEQQGDTVQVAIDKYISFEDLSDNTGVSEWSLLLQTGYLTVESKRGVDDRGRLICVLKIPNKEIRCFYFDYIEKLQREIEDQAKKSGNYKEENAYKGFLRNLISGNIEAFEKKLEQFLLDSFSYFDIGGRSPERVYHSFVLGLIAELHRTYIIKSNREAGLGRYDILLLPKDKKALGIIFEFKSVEPDCSEEVLLASTHDALNQIERNFYDSELRQAEVENTLFVAITFAGKRLKLLHQLNITPSFDPKRQLQTYDDSQSPTAVSPVSSQPTTPDKVKGSRKSEIVRTISGTFNGQDIVFNVFETKGDGDCGIYSLPIPLQRPDIIKLLLDNSANEVVRKLSAPEIVESIKTGHMNQIEKEFKEVTTYLAAQEDIDLFQPILLSQVINQVDPERNKLQFERNFENMLDYLQAEANEFNFDNSNLDLLSQMLAFKDRKRGADEAFLTFCTQENVYRFFVESYFGGNGQLSFNTKGNNFRRETSFLDAILLLIKPPIKLYIWEVDRNNHDRAVIVFEGGDDAGIVTHMLHTLGQQTHFELMAEASVENKLGSGIFDTSVLETSKSTKEDVSSSSSSKLAATKKTHLPEGATSQGPEKKAKITSTGFSNAAALQRLGAINRVESPTNTDNREESPTDADQVAEGSNKRRKRK